MNSKFADVSWDPNSKQNELDKSFLRMAIEFSRHSKCVSKKVCALLVKDNRIISLGINGTLPGWKNCCDVFDSNFDREEHHKWSLKNELHAEVSALSYCTRTGMSAEGSTLYCTLMPCDSCALSIAAVKVKRVVYYQEYDKCERSTEILATAEIELLKIEDL